MFDPQHVLDVTMEISHSPSKSLSRKDMCRDGTDSDSQPALLRNAFGLFPDKFFEFGSFPDPKWSKPF